MSRRTKILTMAAAFILLLAGTSVLVVQTDGFRQFVRQKIIDSTEEATGGRVELGDFRFEVSHLRAVVTNFVIHGTEPVSEAPFVTVARVQLDLRLFTSIKHILDVSYLGVQKPQVNVIVAADGSTNIPNPKTNKPRSDTTILETVVNLAVDHFSLADGLIVTNSRKQLFELRGNNLRAELWFNPLRQIYTGQLGLEPLYVVSGRNQPVNFRVQLPLTLEKDRLEFRDAKITTPTSTLTVSASLDSLRQPRISAHVTGYVSLLDAKNISNLPVFPGAPNTPNRIDVDLNAMMSNEAVDVTGARLVLGKSSIEASGPLKGSQGKELSFHAALALGELGRLAHLAAKPEGDVRINAMAKLDASNNYELSGDLQADKLAFTQSGTAISNVALRSAVHLDSHRLELKGFRLDAFNGEFLGNVLLQDYRLYQVDGSLRNFDVQTVVRTLTHTRLPYSGGVSGSIHAAGDAQSTGTKGITAQVNLSVAPGRQGIPLAGKLNANYNGTADTVIVQNSYVTLPHSRLDLNGALNSRLNVALTSTDLKDFLAALPGAQPNVQLNGGHAKFTGTVTGALSRPSIAGHLDVDRFAIEGRAFQLLATDISAASTGASLQNGVLNRGPMEGKFTAQVGLSNWRALPQSPLSADVSVQGGDVADIIVLAGQPPAGYSGALSAIAHIQGTVGNPRGNADIQASAGTLYREPFDHLEAHVNLADRLVTIPVAYLSSGARRIDVSGEFQHPQNSFSTGRIHAHVKSNQLDLAAIQVVQRARPDSGGQVQLDVDLTGDLTEGKAGSEFMLTQVTAAASARNLLADGKNYGDFTLAASTSGQTVTYDVKSDFAGSRLQVNGKTQLVRDYPTTADATVAGLSIERVLFLAKQTGIQARGTLSGTAHFSGTAANPQGNADLELTSAVIYDEPLDRVRVRATYLPGALEVTQLEITEGTARVDFTGRFDHPQNDFRNGNVQFKVDSTKIDLAKIRTAQKFRPGLGGTFQLTGSGAGTLSAADPKLQLRGVNVNLVASDLTAQKHNLGNLTLKAETISGNQVAVTLDSDLAGSAIHGQGNVRLAADYPVDARVTFNNVAYSRIRDTLGSSDGTAATFDILSDGSLSIAGPVTKTDQLRGALELTRVNFTTLARSGMPNPISIQNQGPIRVAMESGTVRIESAHLVGPQTDFQATGTASLPQQTLNLNVNATANLGLLQSLSRDIVSSGAIAANAAIRGTFSKPQINGRMELKNASLNYTTFPNGISNGNGVIVFNGNSATIRSLTGETGGGKLTASGFVGYADAAARFGLRTQASHVRYRLQQGVSAVGSADIRLTGTIASSTVSGTVTVEQLTYAPQSDLGAILTRTATPVQSESVPSPLLDNMKLDVRVQTSPSLGVQASLAQNLQASADLRVRGTVAQPGVLGRINVSEGQLVFFGSTYTVSSGTIGFYDPVRIAPVLNVNLQTQAKGVDVSLTVTGPVDNMKLSYTSDPPLQFQEIVTLLASGKTPTSDPTLLANQPSQPSQSFEQMGESAIVSKALADPVASRLQRVFGVTQLKIDPAFTSGSQLPTARLTFQQQITNHITFTYTSALDDPNSTIIRAEWAFNQHYSAVATRDQNGLVSVLLYYKRQFR